MARTGSYAVGLLCACAAALLLPAAHATPGGPRQPSRVAGRPVSCASGIHNSWLLDLPRTVPTVATLQYS